MSEPMKLDEIAWDLWIMRDKLYSLASYLDDARLMRLSIATFIVENIADEITYEAIDNPELAALSARDVPSLVVQKTGRNMLPVLAAIACSRTMPQSRPSIQPNARANTDWIADARNALHGEQLQFGDKPGDWNADPECPFDASHNVECPDDPCPMPCSDLPGWVDLVSGAGGDVPGMGREA